MHRTVCLLLRLWTTLLLGCRPALGDRRGNPSKDAASKVPMTELNSTTVASLTTAWQSEPNGRGTFSLIVSCLLTLTLCVWSALHLNVPGQKTSLRGRLLEKTKWVLYGIFAPELVVATAAAQFITARWLRKQIELDSKYRISRGDQSKGMSTHTWTLSQCFYAVMGGFAADSPWVDFRSRQRANISDSSGEDTEEGRPCRKRVAITAEGIRLMSFLGRLPHIEEAQIQDKSKADWMAKSLICVQVGWMVVQVIGRVMKQMPVSLLEINTCGHVACAMAIYLLWWSKPLEIQEPTLLNDGQDQDALALMYMCSSIGAVDGITDIRCFIHVVTEEDEQYWRLPSKSTEEHIDGTETDASDDEETEEITTFLSIGSPGTYEPYAFLGFRDLRSGTETAGENQFVALQKLRLNPARQREPRNSAYIYRFNYNNPPISKDCRVYYSSPHTDDPMPSLRHSRYCRRFLQEQTGVASSAERSTQSPHIPVPLALLRSASKAADLLRSECATTARPSYTPYYFTHVRPPMGEFLGETEYIIRERIPNFPSLHNLGLGQVNLHRDRLRAVLALTAAGYGALHCAGWPTPSDTSSASESFGAGVKFFPTRAERILWIVSSLTIAVSGAFLWGFYLAREFLPAFDRWVSGVAPGAYIENEGIRKRRLKRVNRMVDVIKRGSVYFVLGVFALARVYLVIEAFVSLRDAPVGLYDTPEWTDFLPHF